MSQNHKMSQNNKKELINSIMQHIMDAKQQRKPKKGDENMANTLLDAKKEKEITHIVELLKQIELPDILLIGRDANTLLMRQKEAEAMEREDKSA